MIFGAWREFQQWWRERERASSSSLHSKWGVFIGKTRVGEDPVRTVRVSDCYNTQSWPFGLSVLLLFRSLHLDVRFERFEKIWPLFDVTLKSLWLD